MHLHLWRAVLIVFGRFPPMVSRGSKSVSSRALGIPLNHDTTFGPKGEEGEESEALKSMYIFFFLVRVCVCVDAVRRIGVQAGGVLVGDARQSLY